MINTPSLRGALLSFLIGSGRLLAITGSTTASADTAEPTRVELTEAVHFTGHDIMVEPGR